MEKEVNMQRRFLLIDNCDRQFTDLIEFDKPTDLNKVINEIQKVKDELKYTYTNEDIYKAIDKVNNNYNIIYLVNYEEVFYQEVLKLSFKTLIKKYLYKIFIKKNLEAIKDDNLIKLYNLYDYTFLDEELSEISREIRVRQVKNMLDNNINEFIYHFGDFKTADMWINMPWRLEKCEKIC